ncbi:hypothetical protein BU14_0621s0003 [Porphyra umbilicalis]|uniref:Uncharacterized protein n=1 Tax=Porphyra umbilicalis TaxID=2786 RepID=A0A1X6NQU6_PORUM|nr:hypothetical protein BU14_0621s0003 [Porphyra umbilicalis]|eukprot:OSX70991.1 hypothetical protein BU14_0621s0003 [Porphyra umbilicalis]
MGSRGGKHVAAHNLWRDSKTDNYPRWPSRPPAAAANGASPRTPDAKDTRVCLASDDRHRARVATIPPRGGRRAGPARPGVAPNRDGARRRRDEGRRRRVRDRHGAGGAATAPRKGPAVLATVAASAANRHGARAARDERRAASVLNVNGAAGATRSAGRRTGGPAGATVSGGPPNCDVAPGGLKERAPPRVGNGDGPTDAARAASAQVRRATRATV